MKKLEHLSEIYRNYDTFIIDLWGVMHNGIQLNKGAMEVVKNLTDKKKRVVFLSNAPRPKENVIQFLRELKMDEIFLKNVVTSGEAAVQSLKEKKFGKKFFHLGPKRDECLIEGLEKDKVNLSSCDFILCTGLFDEHLDDLNYYKDLLKDSIFKKLICTNPDLIVHKGNNIKYCAGKIAELYESLGGKVVYFGKPYKEVYTIILKENEKNFVIGDNLNTDIKGANKLKLDSLFISGGIHKLEFKNDKELIPLFKKYNVTTNYYQKNLKW